MKKQTMNVFVKKIIAENRSLKRENQHLKRENKTLKALVDYLRRKGLYGKKTKPKEIDTNSCPKKKGAPFGHPGHTRPKPEIIDEEIKVIPKICPLCGSNELETTTIIEEHIQEDIVIPKKKVTKIIKTVCKCRRCHQLVRANSPDEMPSSYIGPQAKSTANFLRYEVGISNHKIRRIFKDFFGLDFVQASVCGFENQLTRRSLNLYNNIQALLPAQKLLHIDETGWKKDGLPFWLWCYCNKGMAFYHIDKSRGAKVVIMLAGEKFKGVIISDFLPTYNLIESKKQKCLPHLLRIIDRLKVSCHYDNQVREFCWQLKELVMSIISLCKNRARIKDYLLHRAQLTAGCGNLLALPLKNIKAEKLRNKLIRYKRELYTCLFHPWVDSNNNFVERMLRPNVIMRKLTYGNRSERGLKNHAVIMTLLQTAKLNNYRPKDIFYRLLLNPSSVTVNEVIRSP